MNHTHINSVLPRVLQPISALGLLAVLVSLISCGNSTAEVAGLYQGFLANTNSGYRQWTIALYEDGNFVQSIQTAGPGGPNLQIESGTWIVADDTVILSEDGLKDQRWKRVSGALLLSGVTQQLDHWKLWKIH